MDATPPRRRLGEILVSLGFCSARTMQEVLRKQALMKQERGYALRLGTLLLQEQAVTERQLAIALAAQFETACVDLGGVEVDLGIAERVPRGLLEEHSFVPVSVDLDGIRMAIDDVPDPKLLELLGSALHCPVQYVIALSAQLIPIRDWMRASVAHGKLPRRVVFPPGFFDGTAEPREVAVPPPTIIGREAHPAKADAAEAEARGADLPGGPTLDISVDPLDAMLAAHAGTAGAPMPGIALELAHAPTSAPAQGRPPPAGREPVPGVVYPAAPAGTPDPLDALAPRPAPAASGAPGVVTRVRSLFEDASPAAEVSEPGIVIPERPPGEPDPLDALGPSRGGDTVTAGPIIDATAAGGAAPGPKARVAMPEDAARARAEATPPAPAPVAARPEAVAVPEPPRAGTGPPRLFDAGTDAGEAALPLVLLAAIRRAVEDKGQVWGIPSGDGYFVQVYGARGEGGSFELDPSEAAQVQVLLAERLEGLPTHGRVKCGRLDLGRGPGALSIQVRLIGGPALVFSLEPDVGPRAREDPALEGLVSAVAEMARARRGLLLVCHSPTVPASTLLIDVSGGLVARSVPLAYLGDGSGPVPVGALVLARTPGEARALGRGAPLVAAASAGVGLVVVDAEIDAAAYREVIALGAGEMAVLMRSPAADPLRTLVALAGAGVPPVDVHSTLRSIVAGHRVRRLCPFCRRPLVVPAGRLPAALSRLVGSTVFEARGCDLCGGSGERGQFLLVESLAWQREVASADWLELPPQDLARRLVETKLLVTRASVGFRALTEGTISLGEYLKVLGLARP